MTELLRTVVTHDEGDGIRIGEESSGRLDVSSGQAARKKRALSVSADNSDNNQDDQDPPTQQATKRMREAISLPTVCIGEFQQVLERTGIEQCVVTGDLMWKNGKDGYAVLPLRNTGPRPCILSANTTHDSNNAFLVVSRDRIVFKCQSDKCKGRSMCLGAPPASWRARCEGDTVGREESHTPRTTGDDVDGSVDCAIDVPYRHEITTQEVLQLLNCLAMAVDLSPTQSAPQKGIRDLPTVAAILKRFQYGEVWRQWSAKHVNSQEERDEIWRRCDAKGCNNDLNDIVRTVNVANGKTSQSKIGPVERVYFDQPALSEMNLSLIHI